MSSATSAAQILLPALRGDRSGPLPELPIERGRPGPGLLTPVLVSKYADHLPLYRQAGIYAREGVDLDRSTLADWFGGASALLEPLVAALRREVMASPRLHCDDTPVPVLAPGTGRTKTGRLWVYVRDDRSHGAPTPLAAVYFYSPDRKGEPSASGRVLRPSASRRLRRLRDAP
jgi:transposase